MNGLSYPEAADALRVSEQWLRRNIKQFPHHKFGRAVVFFDDDLELIRQQTAVRTTTPPVIAPAALTALSGLKPSGRSRKRA